MRLGALGLLLQDSSTERICEAGIDEHRLQLPLPRKPVPPGLLTIVAVRLHCGTAELALQAMNSASDHLQPLTVMSLESSIPFHFQLLDF